MTSYRIFYSKAEHFRECITRPENVTLSTLEDTHVEVGRAGRKNHDPDAIFTGMQGEVMDAGVAQHVGELAGHTSMSVGDALLRDDGVLFVVMGVGWKEVRRATDF